MIVQQLVGIHNVPLICDFILLLILENSWPLSPDISFASIYPFSPSGIQITCMLDFFFFFLTIFHMPLRLFSVFSLHDLVWLFSTDIFSNS